jgi:fructose-1,6-bisphosphatase/inositol monophosphatase family enzyme
MSETTTDAVCRFDGAVVAALVAEVAARVSHLLASGEVRLLSTGPEGPTTNADIAAQRLLVERLIHLFGPAAIVAEEGPYGDPAAVSHSAPLTWIIDPIDGTSAYLAGRSTYGVQLAAFGDDRLLGGWIACPDLGWQLSAWDDGGFVIEGVQPQDNSSRLIIADGDFDLSHRRALARRGVAPYARSSSCAVEYALLAAGHLEATLYRRSHPWDHAAGSYLVRRAGGQSVRWTGEPYDPALRGEGLLSVANGVDLAAARARLLP